jgi:hypothetical protein
MWVRTTIAFLFSKTARSACLITHTQRFAGFAGLYSPKEAKRRSKPSQSTSQAQRKALFRENTISHEGKQTRETRKPALLHRGCLVYQRRFGQWN